MKHKWEVIVGNLGTVFSGSNGFIAINDFNSWVQESKTEGRRVTDEPVTLMKDDEPYREYDPDDGWFFVEVTDTMGDGSTNYGWVERYKVKANTHIGALLKSNTRRGWKHEEDIPDEHGTRRYNHDRDLICAFVCRYDRETHGHQRFTTVN